MNDIELQTKLLNKIMKLRRLLDEVSEYEIRQAVDEHLTRAFLLVRDGNTDALNGGDR